MADDKSTGQSDQSVQAQLAIARQIGQLNDTLTSGFAPLGAPFLIATADATLSNAVVIAVSRVAAFWAVVTVSAGTPTLVSSFNVTSIADTATGRLTITLTTAFASANWTCLVSVEAASNVAAVANRRLPCVANAGQAAGSVEVNCWDGTGTTSNLADPAIWYVAGFGVQ